MFPARPPCFFLALLGAAIVLSPAIALLPAATPPEAPAFYPHGDHAVLEIYTRLAASGAQRLGPYSRFHFHHPGPALFYLSAPVYALAGQSHEGLKLAALLINGLAVLGMLWAACRLGGSAGTLATAAGLAGFVLWWGPTGLFSNWNPTIVVLPFGLALLAWGAVAAGRPGFLPLAALASSFAVQSHVGCAPAAAAVATTALVAATVPPLRRLLRLPLFPLGAWVRPALVASLVLVALWALPVAEQVDPEGGNLGRILDLSLRRPSRHPSLSDAARALSENATAFLMGSAATAEASRGIFLVLGGAVLVALRRARRAGSAFGVALPVVTLAGMAAAFYSITRVPGWAQPYLLGWTSMLGLAASVGAAVGLAAGASRRWAPVLRAAGVGAVATALGLAALGVRGARAQLRQPTGPPDHLSEWVRLLADPAVPELRSSGARRYLVEIERTVPRAVAVGLILALDKAGVPLAMGPFGPFRFEGRLAPDGSEDAMLRVGAENSAWTGREGARMLSREGGVFLYLLPGRPANGP